MPRSCRGGAPQPHATFMEEKMRPAINPLLILSIVLISACGPKPLVVQQSDGSTQWSWSTQVHRAHPLVGKVWSRQTNQFVSLRALVNSVQSTPIVLLGERHDQPDHHRLQAWLISHLKPGSVVGFEMLNETQADGLSKAKTTAQVKTLTQWTKNGWPDFSIYAPIFDGIFDTSHTAHAIHPSRKRLRDAMMGPTSQTVEAQVSTQPLAPENVERLKKAIVDGHCGYATPSLTNAMVLAQTFKDQWMSNRLMETPSDNQRAVIAGNGHVRRDFGMPNHLKGKVLSIGILEVIQGKVSVDAYTAHVYDYVVFTPRLDEVDPCEKFKESLKKMKLRKK